MSRHGSIQLYPPDTAYPGSQTPVRFRRTRTSTLAPPVRLLGRLPWRRRPPGSRPLCLYPSPYPGFTGTGTDIGWSPGRTADSWLLFATARTRAFTMVLPVRIRSWLSSRTEERRVQFFPGWEGPKNPCPLFRAEIQVSNSNGMTHAIGGRHPMRSPSWVVWEFHPLKRLTSANYPA